MLVRSTTTTTTTTEVRRPPSPSASHRRHNHHHHSQTLSRQRRHRRSISLPHFPSLPIPVVLNQSALELLLLNDGGGGSLRDAATLLSRALERIKSEHRDEESTQANNATATTASSSFFSPFPSAPGVTLAPFPLNPPREIGMILIQDSFGFHPFLAGMAIKLVPTAGRDGASTFTSSSSSSSSLASRPMLSVRDRETMVAALCYNLGLVHHLSGHRCRAVRQGNPGQVNSHEGGGTVNLQQQQQQHRQQHQEQEELLLRKALRFYRLAAAVLQAQDDDDLTAQDEGHDDGHCDGGVGLEASDRLLRAAVLANAGHIHVLLEETRRARACADGLAMLLADPRQVEQISCLLVHRGHSNDTREDEEGEYEDPVLLFQGLPPSVSSSSSSSSSSDNRRNRATARSHGAGSCGGALLLALELNVLLHAEGTHPAPCA